MSLDGECLGTISSDSSEQQQQQYIQQQYGGYAAMGGAQQPPADINPRTGLDAARLTSQFQRPSAELVRGLAVMQQLLCRCRVWLHWSTNRACHQCDVCMACSQIWGFQLSGGSRYDAASN
jgi:hypothetical protein